MSDESVLSSINISQRNRWYYWRANTLPIPQREIETHSANMHMIPADDYISDELINIREGQIITIKGKLVRADASDGWHWISSLTRNDTGNGACEVIFVESVAIN